MPNILKHIDNRGMSGTANKRFSTGRVVSVDTVKRIAMVDVGATLPGNDATVLMPIPYSAQVPQVNDDIFINYSSAHPGSYHLGSLTLGGGNATQKIETGGVDSVKSDSNGKLRGEVQLVSGVSGVLQQSGQIITVDVQTHTVSELSSLAARADAVVFVDDARRGGDFFKAVNSATTPDGGVIFASATSGWVWERVIADHSVYNAKWFGVVGDGSTDDSTNMQAAIDAVPTGGTLLIPASSSYYKLTTSLVVSKSMTFRGENSKVEVRQTGTNKSVFKVTTDNVLFEDLTIAGYQYTTSRASGDTESGITFLGSSNTSRRTGLTVRNCVIQNVGDCGIKLLFASDIVVEHTLIQNIQEAGIQGICSNYGIVNNCRLYNVVGSAGNASTYGLILTFNGDNDVVNNPRSTDWVVSNCVARDCAWEAYDVHGAQRVSFVNNRAYRCYAGIIINYGQTNAGVQVLAPLDINVTGNIIYGQAGYMLRMTGSHSNTFTLTFNGYTTGTLYGDDSTATVQAALVALTSIGIGNVTVSASSTYANTFEILFGGTLTETVKPLTCTGTGTVLYGYSKGGANQGIVVTGAKNAFYAVRLTGNSGDTFTLSFNGYTTGSLNGNASAATVQAALVGLTSIGSGKVTVNTNATYANTLEVLFTGTLTNTTNPLTGTGTGLVVAPDQVMEYAERVTLTGNTIYGHGQEDLSTSGGIYAYATYGLSCISNTLNQCSPCGISLVSHNKNFTLQGNTFIDIWSNTLSATYSTRVSYSTGIGNNTGSIVGNTFGRNTSKSGKTGVASINKRAITIEDYGGNSVRVMGNYFDDDSNWAYKLQDSGGRAKASFEAQLNLPNLGSTYGLMVGTTTKLFATREGEFKIDADLLGTEKSTTEMRRLTGFIIPTFIDTNPTKTSVNGLRNRIFAGNNLTGVSLSATGTFTGSVNNLFLHDSSNVLWGATLPASIDVILTVPSWTSMQVMGVVQHWNYYAKQIAVSYSTDSGANYTAFQTLTGLVGGEVGIDTSTMSGTLTNVKLTFSDFFTTSFQLNNISWNHPNTPICADAVSRLGDTMYGNLDMNPNVASTFFTTANRRIRLNATSTSDVLAYEMSENSGEGKRARVSMTGSGSSSLLTIEVDASSSTNRPNVSIRSGSTEWLLVTTKGTNAGRLSVPTTGANAGLMLGGDALLYRDSASVLRTSGSLTVDSVFKHSGSTLGFFNTTPTTKPTALTAAGAALSLTSTNTTPYGFASSADFNTAMNLINNTRLRLTEMESKVQALGLLA